MRHLTLLFLFMLSVSVWAQTDTSALDKMTPEELLKHYINEKEPLSNYKGPEKIGDSLFTDLNTQVIPTKTVHAYSLYREGLDLNQGRIRLFDSLDAAEQKMKPKVSLGMGRLAYFGDLYSKHFQSPLTARMAYDLNVSQRLTRYLQLNFNVLFGVIGANEFLPNRHENFFSEIRSGGVNLLYDFGNFIPDRYTVRPFISFGAYGFEFLSKTDLKDKDGNYYHYWSDGSIKDKAEASPEAHLAKDIRRDYVYETDVRERNADGFGKYREAALAFPVGAGFVMKVTDRVDVKMNFQMFLSTTDFIDGITDQSLGDRKGNKKKDNFSYTSVALQYDLIAKTRERDKLRKDTLSDEFIFAMDNTDSDKDGVIDLKDECHGTPEGVKVDEKGCPFDDDKDGIPNFRDDEPATPIGVAVNEKGVGLDDEYWKQYYARYMNDSTGEDKSEEIVGNIFQLDQAKSQLGNANKDKYTVELARYSGSIPSDELAFFLSIGDVKSVDLEDGTTVVYIAGEYRKIKTAVKRRDEFRAEGNKAAKVAKIKGKDIIPLTDEEVEAIIKKQDQELLAGNNGNQLNGNNGANNGTGSDTTNTGNNGQNNAGNNNNQNNTGNNAQNNAGNNTGKTLDELPEPGSEGFAKGEVIYRVQLGAFKKRISTSVFNTNAGVIELKTGDNTFRYVTKGFRSIEEAASVRADLVIQGYSDAFITAYKDGHRIPMNQTKATVDKSFKEDLSEDKMFSSVDKKLVVFKIQLGPLKKSFAEKSMDERVKDLKNVEKQTTASGSIRYTSGTFNAMDAAEKYRKELEDNGFSDAFIIATFKGEVISLQEAMELLK